MHAANWMRRSSCKGTLRENYSQSISNSLRYFNDLLGHVHLDRACLWNTASAYFRAIRIHRKKCGISSIIIEVKN